MSKFDFNVFFLHIFHSIVIANPFSHLEDRGQPGSQLLRPTRLSANVEVDDMQVHPAARSFEDSEEILNGLQNHETFSLFSLSGA